MSAMELAMTIWRRVVSLVPRVRAHAPALVALALLAAPASAQSGFEAATIQPSHDCYVGKLPIHTSPGCITVRTPIAIAYGVSSQRDLVSSPRPRVSGGPAWLDSNRYDISAKAERPAPLVDMPGPMLQRLLTERLNLRVHTEFREGPTYDLIKGRNPKLKVTVAGSCKVVDPNEALALSKTGANESGSQFCGSHVLFKGAGAIATTLEAQGVTMEQFDNRILPV
jgi:uncharacterized protein (TIGR03435 family)